MTCEDDDESSCTRNDGQKDRTTNLLISSNVYYVHLGEDNYAPLFSKWWNV